MMRLVFALVLLALLGCGRASLNREQESDSSLVHRDTSAIVVPPIDDTEKTLSQPFLPPGFVPPWGVRMQGDDKGMYLIAVDVNKEVPVKVFILNSANDTARKIAEGPLTVGRWRFHLSKSSLPAGRYRLIITTPEGNKPTEFSVEK